MKKGLALALVLVLLAAFAGCGSKEKQVLKLYNTGEYMGENLISNFEKQFDCKVIVEYFDSNEMMYTKIQAGDSYDVIVPSDYMIERMIKDDYLMEIDKSKIENLSVLADGVKNPAFDPDNKYSVPYFWGNVGILYNHNNVPDDVVKAEGFEVFRDRNYKGRLYMYDSERDSFMMALKSLGYSANTENEAEINEAYEWLVDINKNMEPVYVTDEVIDYMMSGNKDLALVYSGDAVTIMSENPDMSYFTPDCGTNLWIDCMVIPKNAENPDLAHKFINYVLTYDASLDNALTVGYTSPNKEVLDDLMGEGGEFAEFEAYYPRSYDKDEVFHDNETIRKLISELWIKVKAAN